MADNKADTSTKTTSGGGKPANAKPAGISDGELATPQVDSGAKLTGDSSSPDNSEKSPSRRLTVGTGENQVSPSNTRTEAFEGAKVDESDAEWVRSGKKEPVFNPNTGLGVRVGGPFLDQVEIEQNEIRSAKLEGRAPDFNNPNPGPGVPLWTAGQMANAHGGGHPAVAQMIKDNAKNNKVGPIPVTEVDLVGYGQQEVFETKKEEDEALRSVDNTKVSSFDNPGMVNTPNLVEVPKS